MTTNIGSSKCGFSEYTNASYPLIRIYHRQKSTENYAYVNLKSGTNGYPTGDENSHNYGSVGNGAWHQNFTDIKEMFLMETNIPVESDNFYCAYTNQCSGSYTKISDAEDNRSGAGGNTAGGTTWWRTYSISHEEERASVRGGGDCSTTSFLPTGWRFVGTNISSANGVGGACSYGCVTDGPSASTNGVMTCVSKSEFEGDPYLVLSGDYEEYNLHTTWTNYDYYGVNIGAGYETNKLTRQLFDEYGDSELGTNISKLLPVFPGGWQNWDLNNAYGESYIDDAHNYAEGKKLAYRFVIPAKTETNTIYKVTWDIVSVRQYNSSTNIYTSVTQNEPEMLEGTGDPVNPVTGKAHIINVPPFFCTDQTGGRCRQYVANVCISVVPNGSSTPGSGPEIADAGDSQSCSSCSSEASSVGHDGAMQAAFALGDGLMGRNAGSLRIWAALPNESVCTPSGLNYEGSGLDVVLITNALGLRQVHAPQTLADIVPLDLYTYEIRFFYASQTGILTNGLYQTNGAPFVVWQVHNPNGSLSNNVVGVTESRGASAWNYTYVYNSLSNSWTTIYPGGLYQKQLITTINPDGTRILTRIIGNTNGSITSFFSRVYQLFSWGEGVIEETAGTGVAAKTTHKYYDPYGSFNGSHVPLTKVVHPDGSWEAYEYTTLADGSIVPSTVSRGFGNASDSSSGPINQTLYSYTPLGEDGGTQLPDTPRIVSEYVNGAEFSESYLIMLNGERLDIRNIHPGDTWDNPHNLVTKTKYFTVAPNIFRVQSVKNPDGTMAFYNYASSTNNWQTNTVASGQPDATETSIVDGLQTTTVLDGFGRTVSVTVRDIVSQAIFQKDQYGGFDPLDRAQQVTHLDGTSETYDFACCYLDSMVDRDGVATGYLHDSAKRQYGYFKYYSNLDIAITYTNQLNEAGQVVKASRIGSDGSPIVLSRSVYDTSGRLVTQTNALNGVTAYVETKDAITGGLVRTTTNPDGGTRREAYFLDGKIKSITGTAVNPVRYEYGFSYDDMGNACTFEKCIKILKDGETDSSEWETTYTDAMGQITEIRYPGDAYYDENWTYHASPEKQFSYNTYGQRWKEVDPDGVTAFYTYNGKGEAAFSIVAISDSTKNLASYTELISSLGAIQSGLDRITQVTNDVIYSSVYGMMVKRTRNYEWLTGQSTGTLVSCTETSTNGLDTWQKRYGDSSVFVTTHSHTVPGVSRIITTSQPDGTTITNKYSYGRLNFTGNSTGSSTNTYDPHGRLWKVNDARNGTTTYGYNNADLVNSVTSPSPGDGGLAETTSTVYDSMLRATNVVQPDRTSVSSSFLLTGELGLQYGSRTYPVAYGYDYAGRMQFMTNWSAFSISSASGARVTTWNYDSQRGWLAQKQYDDGNGPFYTYTGAGRLASRTWVRLDGSGSPLNTSYAYDAAGSLTNIAYSDATPSVTNSYDRLGRLISVTSSDGTTESLSYNLANELVTDSFTGGVLAGLSVTNGYDAWLRRTNLTAKAASVLGRTTYSYDNTSRLLTVDDGNSNTATYTYVANSPLVSQISFKQGSNTRMTTTKSYDYLNRLTQMSSVPASGVPVNFNYTYNQANQRTKNVLADGSYWIYSYDALGQVIGGHKNFYDGTPVPGQQFDYGFDTIGNRTQTKAGGDQTGGNQRLATYTVNILNQITSRDYPGTNDVVGAALATNTVAVNGQMAWRKGEYFWAMVKSNNLAAAQWEGIKVVSGRTTNNGNLFVPKTPEVFRYDADGNLTNDGRWAYVWDGENRLIQMTVNTNVGPQYQLNFAYDSKSRRIQKVVATNGISISTNKFLYDGWNLVAELKPNNSLLRSYVWGSDLSGSMQGAGGVGGLLIENVNGTNCFPAYDGNGNIMALVNAADGTVSANYDYAAFGEPIRITGVMARNNPFRFSTKYADDESDLLYYGYRYYKPSMGTWANKDPIEEQGFALIYPSKLSGRNKDINLYVYVGNDSVNMLDKLGLVCCCKCPVFYIYISVDSAGMPPSFNAKNVQTTLQSQVAGNIFDSLSCGQKLKVLVKVEGSSPQRGWNGDNKCIYVNRVDWKSTVGIAGRGADGTSINPTEVDTETSVNGNGPTTQTWVNILAHEVIYGGGGGYSDDNSTSTGDIENGQAYPFSPFTVTPSGRSAIRNKYPLCKP